MSGYFFLIVVAVAFALAAGVVALKKRARFARGPAPERAPEQWAAGSFETVYFSAIDGARLEGWFFRPRKDNAPLVIMAPGLTGTKEGLCEDFARAFVEQGIAALLIDYRCFGGSEGEPRHWVDPQRHREDYEAAIAFARSGGLPHIDPERIALWGSSFSGGTSLVTAAKDERIKAVVVQAPYLETSAAQQPTGWAMMRYSAAVMLDLSGIISVYIPALGRPGEWAFAKSKENPSIRDFDGPLGSDFWRALPRPLRGGWENKFLARMLASFDDFQPMKAVAELKCPVLLMAALHDDMVPIEHVRRAHALLLSPRKRLVELPCGHFDMYFSKFAAPNAQAQAAFLAEVFCLVAAPTARSQDPSCRSTPGCGGTRLAQR